MHAILKISCPPLSKINSLANLEGGETSSRWIFKDSFRSPSGLMLLETITSDDGFRQSFFIRIVPRKKDAW